MVLRGVITTSVDSVRWQDYRAAEKGMLLYYDTDPVAESPIREIAEEYPSEVSPDPNYETGTFGFYGCKHSKIRQFFIKNKLRYLFFATRYAGTNAEFSEDLMITGYYHIKQIADTQKLHIRYLNDFSCINDASCIALRADVVHFVSVTNALKITPEILKSWNCTVRITRQSKLVFDEQKTGELLTYFKSKKNITEQYISETKRLEPDSDNNDDDDDEEEDDDKE
jgi:hypothetical protein